MKNEFKWKLTVEHSSYVRLCVSGSVCCVHKYEHSAPNNSMQLIVECLSTEQIIYDDDDDDK